MGSHRRHQSLDKARQPGFEGTRKDSQHSCPELGHGGMQKRFLNELVVNELLINATVETGPSGARENVSMLEDHVGGGANR